MQLNALSRPSAQRVNQVLKIYQLLMYCCLASPACMSEDDQFPLRRQTLQVQLSGSRACLLEQWHYCNTQHCFILLPGRGCMQDNGQG